MIKEEFTLNIGLLKSDMKTRLNEKKVLNKISKNLNDLGVLGFNTNITIGSWKGKQEPSLNLSFINTFNVKEEDLKGMIKRLKEDLSQESILLTKRRVNFEFI